MEDFFRIPRIVCSFPVEFQFQNKGDEWVLSTKTGAKRALHDYPVIRRERFCAAPPAPCDPSQIQMASSENSFFGLKVPEGNDRRELYKSQYLSLIHISEPTRPY